MLADIAGADALLLPFPFAVRGGDVPTLTGLTRIPAMCWNAPRMAPWFWREAAWIPTRQLGKHLEKG